MRPIEAYEPTMKSGDRHGPKGPDETVRESSVIIDLIRFVLVVVMTGFPLITKGRWLKSSPRNHEAAEIKGADTVGPFGVSARL
jgi:hypothetical protein